MIAMMGFGFTACGRAADAAAPISPAVATPVAALIAPTAEAIARTNVRNVAFRADEWGSSIGTMDRDVFARALTAASAAIARGHVADPKTLTIIDFSRPSSEKRLWVVDLSSRELLFEEFVAHGRGSGESRSTRFSNVPESNQSSLGLYRTAETYIGKHGYSLRLDGLEPGVNDNARERAIVIHGADYVNAGLVTTQGRIGRSLGCPALRPEVTRKLIDTVKDGSLVFAYYPEQQWLESSDYLRDTVAAE